MYIKSFIDKLSDFVEQVYKVDTAVIAAFYPEWLTRGKGAVNYLSVPEFPTDSKNGSFLFPGGYIENADLSSYRPITSHSDEYLIKGIQESAKHSRYKDEAPQAPWKVPPFRLMMVGLTTGNILGEITDFLRQNGRSGSAG